MIKNIPVIPPRKKKTGYPDPALSITIGVKIIHIAHPTHVVIVAKDTILAGRIYGK
jgi:hypothetical protein